MSEAPPGTTDLPDKTAPKVAPELKGIGGWLLLPPLHLLLDMGRFVWLTVSAWSAHAAALAMSGMQAAVGLFALNGLVALYALVCLVRLFEKKSYVPTMMTAFYLLIIAKAVADLAVLLIYPDLSQEPDAVYQDSMGVVQSLVPGAIWIAYFHKSERVKNTFVN